jgi:hypothetical protein
MELKGEMGLDRIDPKVSTSEWKSGGSIGWIGSQRRWLWGNRVMKRQEVRPALRGSIQGSTGNGFRPASGRGAGLSVGLV